MRFARRQARKQGKLLADLFGKKEVKEALTDIAKATGAAGPIPTALLTATMATLTTVLPEVLQRNGDDVLLDFNFSGRDMSRYRGSPEGTRHEFFNQKAAGAMMVFTDPE